MTSPLYFLGLVATLWASTRSSVRLVSPYAMRKLTALVTGRDVSKLFFL
jgi:hypothetical protein